MFPINPLQPFVKNLKKFPFKLPLRFQRINQYENKKIIMRIKKTIDGNQYLMTDQNKWVRNFTKPTVPFVDINNTIDPRDHFLFLKNEVQNNLRRYSWIDSEKFHHPNIVIVSDGFDFQRKQKLLAELPKDVTIIGINGSLAKWELPRSMNYYVANNPYKDCMKYLPRGKKTYPKCIASARTNFEFLENYRGTKFKYYPVNETSYSTLGIKEVSWQIDDYRNAVCAAIGLAYHFNAEKVLLLCCDDAFKEERPGAKKLDNGLWLYPQQEIAHGLIDGNLYWLKNQSYKEIYIGDCSNGPNYKNSTYICEERIANFWEE